MSLIAAFLIVGSINYEKLCNEVNQRTGIHRAIVDVVLKGAEDTMISFLEEGFSVKMGEFGSYRPALNAESQDKEDNVSNIENRDSDVPKSSTKCSQIFRME